MPRQLAVFCHAFTAGWREPLDDLIEAFNDSGITAATRELHLGLTGPEVGRRAIRDHISGWCDLEVVVEAEAMVGNESVTINAVREWALVHPGEAVLYCHLKGASRPTEINRRWRHAMIGSLIVPWRENLLTLKRVDAAGPFWLDVASERKLAVMYGWRNSFFAGNFWMASTDYLAGLSACVSEPRGRAEEWIGLNNPRVEDILPGFPDYWFFGLPEPAC